METEQGKFDFMDEASQNSTGGAAHEINMKPKTAEYMLDCISNEIKEIDKILDFYDRFFTKTFIEDSEDLNFLKDVRILLEKNAENIRLHFKSQDKFDKFSIAEMTKINEWNMIDNDRLEKIFALANHLYKYMEKEHDRDDRSE